MTEALTTPVSGTDPFAVAASVLSNPNVVAGIGNLAGSVVGALTGQGNTTAAQQAAAAAAAKAAADAQQTQMLIIGGGVAIVAVVVVIIVVVKRGRK